MRKPTYYLWRNDFSSQEEFEAERKKYADIGFGLSHFWMEIQTLIFMTVLKHWLKITGIINEYFHCKDKLVTFLFAYRAPASID